MKRFTWLLVIMALFLAACAGSGAATPSVPTAAAATQTRTPTPPLFQVTPRSTKVVLTETAVFPVPDQPVGVPMSSVPTPVAAPEQPADQYRLKDWSDEDALALVQALDDFAYKSDLHGVSASRMNTYILHPPIKLSLVEALYRFPNSAYTEALQWKLAVTNGILGSTETDDWIIASLEEGLNSGRYKPGDLGRVLFQYGFSLVTYDVQDLFGPGEDGQILIISTQFSFDEDGLLVALQEVGEGEYDLILIESQWWFMYWRWQVKTNEIRDRTGNDVPEVPVINIGCDLLMLEWHEDRFIDLGRGEINSGSRDYCMIEFDPEEYPGAAIRTIPRDGIEYYAWNGSNFELVKKDYLDFQEHLVFLIRQEEYSALITEIDRLLVEGLPESSYYGAPGSAFPDVLRFYQGMAFIFQDQPAQAQRVFETLAASPTDANFPLVSKAAEIFLENYAKGEDIFLACDSAIGLMEEALDPYRDETGNVPYEIYDQVWGFTYYPLDIKDSCDSSALLSRLLDPIDPASNSDLPGLLATLGIETHKQVMLDMNGDGRQDWVLAVKSYSHDQMDLFLVINYPRGLEVVVPREYWFLNEKSNIQIDLVDLPGLNQPGLLLIVDDYLGIYHLLDTDGGVELVELISGFGADNYAVYEPETGPKYHLFYYWVDEADDGRIYVDFEWTVYRWNAVTLSFDEIDLIPETLFNENNPEKAIDLIQHTLDKISGYIVEDEVATEKARLLYLLGLAYELSGQEQLAIESYWQVWHDFPGSAYALMARAKLEPAGP